MFIALGAVLLVAVATLAGLYLRGVRLPRLVRVETNTVGILYKDHAVSRIIHWWENRVLIWNKGKFEIIPDSFKLCLEQKYQTRDDFAIHIKTTIVAFCDTPELLPVKINLGWKQTYARMLADQALRVNIYAVDMKILSSTVADVIEKVNDEILTESKKHPFTLSSVLHEFGELNQVSIYKTEFQIRQSAKHLKETQSEEATA